MMRVMRRALVLVLVAACGRSEERAQNAPPVPASAAPAIAAEMRSRLADKQLFFAAAALDDAKPEDMKAIAVEIAPTILVMWDFVREDELKNSRVLGIDHARGKSRKNCTACETFREALDQLAPHAPAVAAHVRAQGVTKIGFDMPNGT
jgi:hypothetical protein